MKKLLLVSFLCLLAVGAWANSNKGDVNGDNKIDVEDVVGIVNKILEEPADDFIEANADVNGDGKIDVDDVVAVVNIILNAEGAVEITEAKGWLESAYVKFNLFEGAKTYHIYIKGGQKIMK